MPRPQRYVSRSDLGWGPSPAGYANPRKGLVIHYDSSNLGLAGKPHSACVSYWKNTRRFHTGPSRGWADIGYSFFACPHGYVLEGRGLFKQQAAQPGGNATYYSCTLAGGPSEQPTSDQIEAVRQLRQWLMEPDSSIRGTVLGHRDFIPTSCPGNRAYALVRNGTFAKKPRGFGGSAPITPDEPAPEIAEDLLDMADVRWMASNTDQELPRGERVCLLFQNGTDDRITKDNPYASVAFSDEQFFGSWWGRVLAFEDDGETLAPVAYKLEMGKVEGGGADEEPFNTFDRGVHATTEFCVPINEVTYKDQRLRLYVTALVDGAVWRGGGTNVFYADRK